MSKNNFKDKGKVYENPSNFRKCCSGSYIGHKAGYADQDKQNFGSIGATIAVYHIFSYFHPMKFFAFIMASLVLALSLLPCAEEGLMMKECKVKSELTKQHNEQDHQEHTDACSPFCHCTCCSGFSIHQFFAATSSPIGSDSKFYTPYLPGNPIEYSPPIWQPPRLLA